MMVYKSAVYNGEELLGEVEIYPVGERNDKVLKEEVVRISYLSTPSERCPPLAVLHTINPNGVCFKMEEKTQQDQSHNSSKLSILHSTCLKENKTAVVSVGDEEIHLVPMNSRKNESQCPCFWAFNVTFGLYDSCLVMLNLRCLGIVFDLDETLIVANTMRSFEDRIEALQRKMSAEIDPQRISGMLSEVKRYQDDKIILKQYVDNDQVVDNGVIIRAQSEIVPALSDIHQPLVRPLIRLQDKNIILTRINPQIRDTSVLVRLRPAWDDLRNYLTARGRKRFEVYVCTMAERDYALEMWRLLDPESNLISSKELLDRIVCVKYGSRKSLFNVFQEGSCHPKMALVIDDRLNVWNDKDQPRVHVVPAFAPYYAPQAESNNAVPILCVARNVACNVRGGFFKDFDDGLLQQISEISYEDDFQVLPSPPDVSNYLVSEDETSVSYANKDQPFFDGMADIEVERRLKEAVAASLTLTSVIANLDPRLASSLQYAVAASSCSAPIPASQGSSMVLPNVHLPQVGLSGKQPTHIVPSEPSLQSSPAREEGEIGESELDPDTRRRLLILQHGIDMRDQPPPSEPAFPVAPPVPVAGARGQVSNPPARVSIPAPSARVSAPISRGRSPVSMPPARGQGTVPWPQSHGNWFPLDEGMRHGRQNRPTQKEYPTFLQKTFNRDDRLKSSHSMPGFYTPFGEEASLGQSTSSNRNTDFYSERNGQFDENPIEYLQDIAEKCATKVEFRTALVASLDLQFSMEVWFAGEKVGNGTGRTRREAQLQAAEGSLMHLAKRYLATVKDDSDSMPVDGNKFLSTKENGFIEDMHSTGYQAYPVRESIPFSTISEPPGLKDPRLDASKQLVGPVSALKEICMMEGLGNVVFQAQPPPAHSMQKDKVHAQVEIDGQVLGKGVGLSWDEAKMQAADEALLRLKPMLGQYNQKRQGSPRSFQDISGKRLKQEFPRDLQRIPSARYPKNPFVVP